MSDFCGESPEQSQTFARWSEAMRGEAVPLRTALTQIAEEFGCAPEEDRFPAHTRFMQKDGTASN